MSWKIGSDSERFKDIVKNKIKNNLGKYVSSENLLGQQGKKLIKIPINTIDLPKFTFGNNGGAGQGDGKIGDPVGNDPKKGNDKGKAGEDSAEHAFSAEFSPDELAQILTENLELPNIEDKGKGRINTVTNKYNSINNNGPEGLKNFKRTYKEALKRSISSGTYDPTNPKVIPIKSDKRYKSASTKEEPDCNTVLIFMRDISGSITEEMCHLIKSEIFWIDLWLKSQYKSIEIRFIVHDADAREVTREEFFTISEAGGTVISSAYKLCAQIMEEEYPFSDFNVYTYHFTDGDSWSSDNDFAISLLKDKIVPNSNLFSYGQVVNEPGDYMNLLEHHFRYNDKVILSEIKDRNDILPSIKKFLGKGK